MDRQEGGLRPVHAVGLLMALAVGFAAGYSVKDTGRWTLTTAAPNALPNSESAAAESETSSTPAASVTASATHTRESRPPPSTTSTASSSPSKPTASTTAAPHDQRTFAQIGTAPRVLVLMTDNRLPAPGQYQGLAAVVNEAYAARHGYDFMYWHVPAFNASDVARVFGTGVPPLPPPVPNAKFLPAVYHPLLARYRAAPWARLLAFWNVTVSRAYDAVLFTDSDAVLGNPNMSFPQFLEAAAATPRLPPARTFGVPVLNASVLLYGNIPYAVSNYPVTGFVAWVPGAATRALLVDWWNIDAGRFDFRHAFEQFGLWHLMSTAGFGHRDICVHNAGQMGFADPTGYVKHFGSDRAAERVPQLAALARRAVDGVDTDAALGARVRRVAARAAVRWDALELAGRVAADGGTVPSGVITDADAPGDVEWGRVGGW